MKIVCDACSAKYSIADEKVRGKVFKIRCKKCSNIIVVRGSVGEAEQAAPTYDQKETKVFDYQGYDGPGDSTATGAGDDAVWHLVIDQEQVGPMTVAEVHERFQRGEIDAESYVWREGFGDWERLVDVDAFAGLAGSGGTGQVEDAAGMGGLGGLFGGAPIDDGGRTVQSDPADLFAARAGDDEGGDLFSGGMAAGADQGGESEGLFAAGGGGGAMAASAPSRSTAAASLTGQRNENSVLFSLNNLAALASDSPRASQSSTRNAAVSSSNASGDAAAAGGGPVMEGSGLIDIRSMAQVYLGDNKGPTRSVGAGSADDLPVFSQSSFESASPVLLPSVQPAVNNRLLIALVGLIGVLVIAAVVLVVIVLKGGGDKDRPKVAAAETGAGAGPAVPASGAATSAPAAAAAGAPPTGAPSSEGAASGAPEGGEPPQPAAAVKDDRKDDRKSDRKTDRDHKSDRDRKPEREKPAAAPTPKPAPDPLASSGCDEVTCLVEPDKPCCRKGGRKSGGSSGGSTASAPDPSLPDRPDRNDVKSGVGRVMGSVNACGSRSPGGGKVMVKIKISPGGSVSSASASGGNASLNGCVESAVKRAKFPKSQLGASVNYPFIF